ncbi:MAG: hypothetical protein Satyrvirus27_16 [Satyrvirus sp.]|uniref:Uncharacterized protein n=1 Tax=Satyrvirus sp. TaxID=2487771 RepID=A0A3G5AJF8_9VIRU|nr:MAG: hypothetical protein Satyrvirus27_16 [Satyrvirus sp.]
MSGSDIKVCDWCKQTDFTIHECSGPECVFCEYCEQMDFTIHKCSGPECVCCEYCEQMGHTIHECSSAPKCKFCGLKNHDTDEHLCQKCFGIGHSERGCVESDNHDDDY